MELLFEMDEPSKGPTKIHESKCLTEVPVPKLRLARARQATLSAPHPSPNGEHCANRPQKEHPHNSKGSSYSERPIAGGITAQTNNNVEMARRATEVSICDCDSPDESSESARTVTTIATTEQRSPIPTGPTNNRSNGPIRPIEKIPSPDIVSPRMSCTESTAWYITAETEQM
jgi:hypothetical protein